MLEIQNPFSYIPVSAWHIGSGPKEYGLRMASKPRKKLKGWQKELKRK